MYHITARLAWHDRGWDGKVCFDPASNTYCTGSRSLLSERIAREKDLAQESSRAAMDEKVPDYLPPCFWSSSAFSAKSTEVIHRHPFPDLKMKMHIPGTLPPNSLYTWPFRLSMTHQPKSPDGKYFPDIEQRIERYRDRLTVGKSLIFFYLNYDNPISADEYKYALVGCARLTAAELSGHFPFEQEDLKKIQKGKGMQNFPAINWALRLTHAGGNESVRLPYHEYVQYIRDHPDEEAKLEDIKVLVDEPSLATGFKFVSEQIADDHALLLLYKLHRAFTAAKGHGITRLGEEIATIERFIEEAWANRGLVPGLASVIGVLADLSDGEATTSNPAAVAFVDAMRVRHGNGRELLDQTFTLLTGQGTIPMELAAHRSVIRNARVGSKDHKTLLSLARKLCLFSVTPCQVSRILQLTEEKIHPFGGLKLRPAEIAANPYLLTERYIPSTVDRKTSEEDQDQEQRTDGVIDHFMIDVGMFPDKRYLEPDEELQHLTPAGKERLRAFALEALNENEEKGHCFAPTSVLVELAASRPLFYRNKISITENQFIDNECLEHFRERIAVRQLEEKLFFYRHETKQAEEIVKSFVAARLEKPRMNVDMTWLGAVLRQESAMLSDKIAGFEVGPFETERRHLIEGVMAASIYCITGRPGSGKSEVIKLLVSHFNTMGETTKMLAPTGKAALRLAAASGDGGDGAETIDRLIFRSGLNEFLSPAKALAEMRATEKFQQADNFIVDETSMVDLRHMALLFKALEVNSPQKLKRIILVGDENQLPPIGCGRPFFDIIEHLRGAPETENNNHVRLKTNCRQEDDTTVLDAAHIFTGKDRYHDDLFERILKGGKISKCLDVAYWRNASELHDLVDHKIMEYLGEIPAHHGESLEVRFNLFLKLYDTGQVPGDNAKELALDRAQVLTPYRGGPSGSLGLSEVIRAKYRHESWPETSHGTAFSHSDKIICTGNVYGWNFNKEEMELRISNGSIGVVCNKANHVRKSFFPEQRWGIEWKKGSEEGYELAYGLTVHKAQGSEFREVIVVIPERRALLSRELVYTALTRSKTKLTLLVEQTPRPNPLLIARDRSVLMVRNSSIFTDPIDRRRIFEPEPGKKVKSKIEYMIYRELMVARDAGKIDFEYEAELELLIKGKKVRIHPDFIIRKSGKTFYWEHLGMLDRTDYSADWRDRLDGYRTAGLAPYLVTTDDLHGVGNQNIQNVIADFEKGIPKGLAATGLSSHHYTL